MRKVNSNHGESKIGGSTWSSEVRAPRFMVLRAQRERYWLRASPYLWALLGPRDPPLPPPPAPPVSLAALGGDQRAGAKSTSLINNNLTKEVIMEVYQGNQVPSALVENYLASCRHQATSCQEADVV